MRTVEEAVSEAIERYNRYRSPEATAKLVEAKEGGFTVDFSGPFCGSCGAYDYFEDLVYELKEAAGLEAWIEGFESAGGDSIRVKYVLGQVRARPSGS
ncbi:MAG: hypothetical protein JTT11_07480 [Candidatus Brockarchaeota archaeon]|nr:hypothetical protein [Candidatus Brockarchaeota archaeon]